MRLVERRLPAEYEVTGDVDAWPLVGAALLSRMTGTMRHIFRVQRLGRGSDAATLGRTLYEHAIHLAWLAADPTPARLEEWRKHDLKSRLAADTDASQHGISITTAAERAALEAQVAGMTGNRLVLEQLAEAADAHWGGKLPGMGAATESRSFSGLYVALYRNYSGTSHASYRGLNPVVEDVTITRKRVVLEDRYEGRGPYGMATTVYALALFVAAESLGWPRATEVTAAFDRYPARDV
jgi:hypothetical protein